MSAPTADTVCTAFAGHTRIATGDIRIVAAAVKEYVDGHHGSTVLVFDDTTSEHVELDLRGGLEDVLARLPLPVAAPAREDSDLPADARQPAPRPPGRPRLGVIAKEVTLLPRHWDWLTSQPGGASVTLRKLVEVARKEGAEADRVRAARDSANRFMTAVAGDLPGYEEATRALYSGDSEQFRALVESWEPDVREHAMMLAEASWSSARGPLEEGGADAI